MLRKNTLVKALIATAVLSVVMIQAAVALADGVSIGVVVSKGNNDESITLSDEDGTRLTYTARGFRWRLVPGAVDAITQTPIRSTVKVTWQTDRHTLTQLTVLCPPASKPTSSEGTFIGVLTAKGEKFVIVKGGDGDPLKFIAHQTVSGRDTTPDPDAIKAITNRRVNDRVFVKWDLDKQENQCLTELRLAKPGEKTTYPKRDANKTTTPTTSTSQEGGTVIGRVDDIGGVGIAVRNAEGKVEHYLPRMVPADGDKPARLDPDILKTISNIHMDATVQITWVQDDKTKRITAIKTVPRGTTQPVDDSGKPLSADGTKDAGGETVKVADFKDGDEGTFAGTVLENSSASVTIRTDEDSPRKLKFAPQWIGGSPAEGGGLDQAMQKIMEKLKPGQKVQVKWLYQERLHAVSITPSGGASEKPASESKDAQSSTYTGTLIQKNDDSITVKIDGDNPQTLKFIPKENDKDMLTTFRNIDVGTKVQVQWVSDEHLRVVKLTKARTE
jgi:hypothetical protein